MPEESAIRLLLERSLQWSLCHQSEASKCGTWDLRDRRHCFRKLGKLHWLSCLGKWIVRVLLLLSSRKPSATMRSGLSPVIPSNELACSAVSQESQKRVKAQDRAWPHIPCPLFPMQTGGGGITGCSFGCTMFGPPNGLAGPPWPATPCLNCKRGALLAAGLLWIQVDAPQRELHQHVLATAVRSTSAPEKHDFDSPCDCVSQQKKQHNSMRCSFWCCFKTPTRRVPQTKACPGFRGQHVK